MDPNTPALDHKACPGPFTLHNSRADLGNSDIVAGNRYSLDLCQHRFIPDESGDWTALVTYRGPNAPERLAVLPVGTRVRLTDIGRAQWGDPATDGVGTVVKWHDFERLAEVEFVPGEYRWFLKRDDIEVVSLPEPAKSEPKTATAPCPKCTDYHLAEWVCPDHARMFREAEAAIAERKPTGYDGDEPAYPKALRTLTSGDCEGNSKAAEKMGMDAMPFVLALTDYTPPAVLARRKREPVAVRVDNGWDLHD